MKFRLGDLVQRSFDNDYYESREAKGRFLGIVVGSKLVPDNYLNVHDEYILEVRWANYNSHMTFLCYERYIQLVSK